MQGKLEAAEKPTLRALEVAEEAFGSDNPGLVKALRACAMLRERQDNIDGARQYLKRAYTVMYSAYGILHPGVQLIIDEYVQVLMKNDNLLDALEMAEGSFNEAQKGAGAEHAVTMDCAQRLSQVYCRAQRYDEAEKLVEAFLNVRAKKFGPESVPVAASLASLAYIRDAKGIIDEDTENMLQNALEIFHKVEGVESNNFRSAFGLLNRLKEKRKAAGLEEQDIKQMEPDAAPSKVARAGILMNNATFFFKEGKYSTAEHLLEEALDIFIQENGQDHPTSKAAVQNLGREVK